MLAVLSGWPRHSKQQVSTPGNYFFRHSHASGPALNATGKMKTRLAGTSGTVWRMFRVTGLNWPPGRGTKSDSGSSCYLPDWPHGMECCRDLSPHDWAIYGGLQKARPTGAGTPAVAKPGHNGFLRMILMGLIGMDFFPTELPSGPCCPREYRRWNCAGCPTAGLH